MQVVSPFERSVQGYQAGFGQMQQLNEVRRQRVADQQAAQLHNAQLAYTQAQTSALEQEQEKARQIQDITKQVITGEMDGAPPTVMKPLYQQLAILTGDDAHLEQFNRLDAQEKNAMLSASAERYNIFNNLPIEQALSYLETQIQAAPQGSEQRAGLEALYGLAYAAERNEPGSGAAIAKATIRANAGILAATNEATFGLYETLFDAPAPDKPSAFEEQRQAYLEAHKLQLGRPLTQQEIGALTEEFMNNYASRGRTTVNVGTTSVDTATGVTGAGGDDTTQAGPPERLPPTRNQITVQMEDGSYRTFTIAGSEAYEAGIRENESAILNQNAFYKGTVAALDLVEKGAIIDPEAQNFWAGVATNNPEARKRFINLFAQDISDELDAFDQMVNIRTYSLIQSLDFGTQAFNTPEERERIAAMFPMTNKDSILKSAVALDYLEGDGTLADRLLEQGKITIDEYGELIDDGGYIARNLMRISDNVIATARQRGEINSDNYNRYLAQRDQYNQFMLSKLQRQQRIKEQLEAPAATTGSPVSFNRNLGSQTRVMNGQRVTVQNGHMFDFQSKRYIGPVQQGN